MDFRPELYAAFARELRSQTLLTLPANVRIQYDIPHGTPDPLVQGNRFAMPPSMNAVTINVIMSESDTAVVDEDPVTLRRVVDILELGPRNDWMIERLTTVLNRECNGVMINPATADYSYVTVARDGADLHYVIPPSMYHPRVDGAPRHACFFLTALVLSAKLLAPEGDNGRRKTIRVVPIDHEWQRAMTYLGAVAGKDDVGVYMDRSTLKFCTRPEEQLPTPVPPVTPGVYAPYHQGAARGPDNRHHMRNYDFPAALCVDTDIPIYNATSEALDFDAMSWEEISNLPQLTEAELKCGSIVTVGFTAILTETQVGPNVTNVVTTSPQFVVAHFTELPAGN